MIHVNLELHSEKYAATGNLAADGYKKLLGTPSLELLGTVIREAIQNSCDAAKNGNGPEIHLRLRRVDELQLESLRRTVFAELPVSNESQKRLKAFLNKDDPWVLEIADFNTIGLAGPTRADKIPVGNDRTDFIDFMRNVGSRRDTVKGGGTYGYGKTSLYLSSACSTIIVDTQTHFMGDEIRRLIACHLGDAYQAEDSDHIQRYTGRHWWGLQESTEGIVEPVLNDNASELAQSLGMPQRGNSREGTTIMILDPVFNSDTDPEDIVGLVAETILWNFWPRLMRDTPHEKKITLRLELDGKEFPMPIPEEFPPLDIFSSAMRALRNGSEDVKAISSNRPSKRLGKLAIKKSLRLKRSSLLLNKSSIIPEVSSHIAVMRPVELVVRYYDGPPLPDNRVEWAGVFVTDDDDEIEEAFAKSEPPAHDDWQPKILPSGNARTYVNVAIRRIKEIAQNVAHPIAPSLSGNEAGPSLAKVANKLGQFLDSVLNDIPEPGNSRARPVRPINHRKTSLSQPIFMRLEEVGNASYAIFSIRVSALNDSYTIKAEPKLVMEGGSTISEDLGELTPRIIKWKNQNGDSIGFEPTIQVEDFEGDLELYVSLPDDFAITVSASILGNSRSEKHV